MIVENENDHERARASLGSATDFGQDHFGPDESEDDGQAGLEINEAIDHVREKEVERAQSENGADVRGVDDELILGDGEDGRDGIDREDQVHDVDQNQDERERGEHQMPVDAHREMSPVEFLRHAATARGRDA